MVNETTGSIMASKLAQVGVKSSKDSTITYSKDQKESLLQQETNKIFDFMNTGHANGLSEEECSDDDLADIAFNFMCDESAVTSDVPTQLPSLACLPKREASSHQVSFQTHGARKRHGHFQELSGKSKKFLHAEDCAGDNANSPLVKLSSLGCQIEPASCDNPTSQKILPAHKSPAPNNIQQRKRDPTRGGLYSEADLVLMKQVSALCGLDESVPEDPGKFIQAARPSHPVPGSQSWSQNQEVQQSPHLQELVCNKKRQRNKHTKQRSPITSTDHAQSLLGGKNNTSSINLDRVTTDRDKSAPDKKRAVTVTATSILDKRKTMVNSADATTPFIISLPENFWQNSSLINIPASISLPRILPLQAAPLATTATPVTLSVMTVPTPVTLPVMSPPTPMTLSAMAVPTPVTLSAMAVPTPVTLSAMAVPTPVTLSAMAVPTPVTLSAMAVPTPVTLSAMAVPTPVTLSVMITPTKVTQPVVTPPTRVTVSARTQSTPVTSPMVNLAKPMTLHTVTSPLSTFASSGDRAPLDIAARDLRALRSDLLTEPTFSVRAIPSPSATTPIFITIPLTFGGNSPSINAIPISSKAVTLPIMNWSTPMAAPIVTVPTLATPSTVMTPIVMTPSMAMPLKSVTLRMPTSSVQKTPTTTDLSTSTGNSLTGISLDAGTMNLTGLGSSFQVINRTGLMGGHAVLHNSAWNSSSQPLRYSTVPETAQRPLIQFNGIRPIHILKPASQSVPAVPLYTTPSLKTVLVPLNQPVPPTHRGGPCDRNSISVLSLPPAPRCLPTSTQSSVLAETVDDAVREKLPKKLSK